jgi:IS5 family transposase
MEDALYDIESMRRFAGIDLSSDPVPDETTILNFRHLLERHALTEKFFDAIDQHLDEYELTVQKGTLVDAILIAAPAATKNKQNQRDPQMSQTKKGNQYYFGMKAHRGGQGNMTDLYGGDDNRQRPQFHGDGRTAAR